MNVIELLKCIRMIHQDKNKAVIFTFAMVTFQSKKYLTRQVCGMRLDLWSFPIDQWECLGNLFYHIVIVNAVLFTLINPKRLSTSFGLALLF